MNKILIGVLCMMAALLAMTGIANAQGDGNSYDRVLRDANTAMQQLNGFWTAELANRGIPYTPPSHVEYYHTTGNRACGNGSESMARNAFYCPDGNFINFDIDWFVDEYTKRFPGDAHTFWILAHEWGHSVQNAWRIAQPGVDQYTAPYRKEVQADCLAGAFLKQALSQGTLIPEAGDGQAIYTGLIEGGDGDWFDPRTHGRPDQRVKAFNNGYANSSGYCRQTDGIPQE